MKTNIIGGLISGLIISLLPALSHAAVICGETVDTSRIQVRDNYMDGREWANKPFMDAILFEGTQLRTTLCDIGKTRYLIVKKSAQSSANYEGAIVMAYPLPNRDTQSDWK